MNKAMITGGLLVATLLLSSCGGSRAVTGTQVAPPQQPVSNPLGEAVAVDKCQAYAEDPTATSPRAWAVYNDFDMKNAQRYATAMARADLASQIATMASDAIGIYNEKYSNAASNGAQAQRVSEAANRAQGQVKTVAEELIRGSRVVMSSFYRQADGTYDAYVCVEMDYDSVLEQLKNNAEIQRVISDAEKARMDANVEDFEEAMQSSFEMLRDKKAQGV